MLYIQLVDNEIRYIEVDFTFRLPEYVLYIEEFVTSRFYSIHFTVMHLSMSSPRGGGGSGNPREFDRDAYPQGGDLT